MGKKPSTRGFNPVKGKMPDDPNLTVNVKNDKLEELLDRYGKDGTADSLNQLVNHIRTCRLLVPAMVNQDKKPVPCFIRNANQEVFLPVYTTKEQIPEEPKSQAILNMPYDAINNMALNPAANIMGIVINPFSTNLIFKPELLKKIREVAEQQKNGQVQNRTMKLTEEQYHVFVRKQLEFGLLPKRFFTDGKAFLDQLCDEKETFLDQLYEEAYQEKRLYPYLTEEFSVMVMNISEDLLIVRVDFPERNMEVPSCYRIYFTWNPAEEKGRYFTIEKTKEKEIKLLGEMPENLKHITHGDAPVEGAELQKIIDLVKGGQELTS